MVLKCRERIKGSQIIFTKLRTSFHDFYPNRESIFILIVNKKDSVVLPYLNL